MFSTGFWHRYTERRIIRGSFAENQSGSAHDLLRKIVGDARRNGTVCRQRCLHTAGLEGTKQQPGHIGGAGEAAPAA
jgi:hypothetical protein